RFNAYYMQQIYEIQPESGPMMWDRTDHRPLEGFVFAVTPFNFVSINGNLPTAPAMMGNVVVWKPASTAVYTSHLLMQIFRDSGLPAGVINMIFARGAAIGDAVLRNEHLAGIHFTGSTATFQHMWKTIGENIANYHCYPRIVGETGGKDFIVAHASADPAAVNTAIIRGAFEYQGQKCSAASRVYVPDTLWPDLKDRLLADLTRVKMGPVEDFTNFINAVIDRKAYDRIASYIDHADESPDADVIAGGGRCADEGYFIEPTVIVAAKPDYRSMCEEIFGPVVTIYVYPAGRFAETLEVVDRTSPFALTGAIFAQDRAAITHARDALAEAAGNFYINDKPT
ncbi:MAG: aldehyde dehydrogenase family protein, partial [Phycisphaerae bacterium]|nr:aldehyde dehydrogenase family protein [Phycisphaerae bacterium]